MRRAPPDNVASQGFVRLLKEGMEKRGISLNQLAQKAGLSPAYLSRIMNRQRGLPSDRAILRLAQVLDLQPNERLLIEAGRIPQDLQASLSRPRIPELLRAVEELSETEQNELMQTVKALALKQHRGR